jgi:stage II sporulation protein P
MVSIGEEVARILREGGVEVIHDKSYHDYPSYNGSYNNARKTIADYLEEYPSIRMVLDIHRDAAAMSNGGQLNTSATVGGQPSAQIMVVIGTDATGNHHPNWRQNLSLALKLSAQLERENPGITRPIHLRPERFNMDMTAGSLLVEVGAAGDTHEEAMIAANALARAVLALARGTSQ